MDEIFRNGSERCLLVPYASFFNVCLQVMQAEPACLGAGMIWVKLAPFSPNFFDSEEQSTDIW